MDKIPIGDRIIGETEPCFIIAEAGVNHNGEVEFAKQLVDIAKNAGADAVKFQTFRTEDVMTKDAKTAEYQKQSTGEGIQYDMVKKLELTEDEFVEISNYAKKVGITFISTPFDEKSADALEKLEVPAFKLSSGDLTDLPLLEYIGKKGKPMLVSTGMANIDEVKEAIETIKNAGNEQIVLLHCTSNYPAKIEDSNLKAMNTLRYVMKLPVGYSDHTLGFTVSIAAVTMGAVVLEKHFTIDNDLPGPDHKASLNPEDLKEMVTQIRLIEKALGSGEKKPVDSERDIIKLARRSIVAIVDIPQGTVITKDMLGFKRPGTGLSPKHINEIIGKRAKIKIKKDEMISFDNIT